MQGAVCRAGLQLRCMPVRCKAPPFLGHKTQQGPSSTPPKICPCRAHQAALASLALRPPQASLASDEMLPGLAQQSAGGSTAGRRPCARPLSQDHHLPRTCVALQAC